MLDAGAIWGSHAYEKALHLDEMPDELITTLAEYLPRKKSPLSFLPIFPLGGAYSEVDEDATAFGGSRGARWVLNIGAFSPDPAVLAEDRIWVRELWEALRPYASNSGGYVNFMAEYEADRVRTALRHGQVRAAGPDQVLLRPGERLPPQRQHPARLSAHTGSSVSTTSASWATVRHSCMGSRSA
jgi:hypothetical protein